MRCSPCFVPIGGADMPVVISMSATALLFSFVLHPYVGILNNFLRAVNLEHLIRPWLAERGISALYTDNDTQNIIASPTTLTITAATASDIGLWHAGRA